MSDRLSLDRLLLPGPSTEAYCLHCQSILFRLPQGHTIHKPGDICVCEWHCCPNTMSVKHGLHIQYRPSSVDVGEFTRIMKG